MSLTFAIADLHGRFDLLEEALSAIEARAAAGTVVFLGDYVDRGPQSRQIIERLMAGPPPGWEWVCLTGNHEDMLVELLRFPEPGMRRFIANGGRSTLASYDVAASDALHDLSAIPATHGAWLKALPSMHVDLHRVYVHAAVDRWRPLHRQHEDTLLWDLYPDDDEGGHGDFHVVHGHHAHATGPVLKKHRTNLDTLAWRTGRLMVGVFENDQPGGPVDLIEVLGEPAS